MAMSKRSIDLATDVTEIDTQLETQSSLKKNIVWTTEMDNCLTEALIEQVQRGLKPDRSFPHTAYQAACDELFVKCDIRASVAHLKNHIKTQDLGAFQDMLNFGSGFAFNKVTRMMDAEPKVWEVYLKVYPTSVRGTGFGIASSVGRIGGIICPLVAVSLVEGCHQTEAILSFELVIVAS